MSYPLFSIFLICALDISFNLLLLDSATQFGIRIFSAIINMLTTALMTFVFCYSSENITEDLFDIGDAFYGSSWYRLPIRQQKLVILSIIRAQGELRLDALGFAKCSLYTFLQVVGGSVFAL